MCHAHTLASPVSQHAAGTPCPAYAQSHGELSAQGRSQPLRGFSLVSGVPSQECCHTLRTLFQTAPLASNKLHTPSSFKLPAVASCDSTFPSPQAPPAHPLHGAAPPAGGPSRRRPCAGPRAPPRHVALPRDPERALPLAAAAARARGGRRETSRPGWARGAGSEPAPR